MEFDLSNLPEAFDPQPSRREWRNLLAREIRMIFLNEAIYKL